MVGDCANLGRAVFAEDAFSRPSTTIERDQPRSWHNPTQWPARRMRYAATRGKITYRGVGALAILVIEWQNRRLNVSSRALETAGVHAVAVGGLERGSRRTTSPRTACRKGAVPPPY